MGWETHHVPHEVAKPKRSMLNPIKSLDLTFSLQEIQGSEGQVNTTGRQSN